VNLFIVYLFSKRKSIIVNVFVVYGFKKWKKVNGRVNCPILGHVRKKS